MLTDKEFAEALKEALADEEDNTIEIVKELMGNALTDKEKEL